MKTRLCPFLCLALWSVAVIPGLHAAGGPGYALSFDGDDDRVQVGVGLFPTVTNSFTIELWANPTGLRTLTAEANSGVSLLAQRFAVFPEHFSGALSTDHAGAGLSIGSNGISVFEHALDHLPSVLVYPTALSGWTHVALVYVNHTPQLYVNGTLVRTGLTSTIPFIHPSASLGTSAIGYGTYHGQLDEVRIWNAPLSQAQIQANMNRSLAGGEPNLVVYYRCDEGTGLLVVDHAPAAPSAPIANGTLTISGGITNGPAWVLSGIQPFSPFSETLPATATGDFTNRLNGIFNSEGADTRVWFEWGTNMNYGNLTPAGAIGNGTSNTNWSEVLGGLENDVTYHFRAVASNAFGIALGANLSFITPPSFTDINADLPGVTHSSAAWGDLDNDGDLDIVLTGSTGFVAVARVYRNNGDGMFTDLNAGLPGVFVGSVAWGDFDNDGDLDILLTGTVAFGHISCVYRNNGNGTFTDLFASLPGVYVGSVAWGDFDNDGDLDILLTGASDIEIGLPSAPIARVYRNNGDGTFTDLNAGLPGAFLSSVAWGDFDNDGDLDILLTGGQNINNSFISRVYRNNTSQTNTAPNAPTALTITVHQGTAALSWNAATDAQTPGAGLTYNVRVGTTPGGSDVMGPMTGAGGVRRLPQMGNAQHGLTALMSYNDSTPYYLSVQAVDGAFAGSAFSSEASFRIHTLMTPPTTTNILTGDLNSDGLVDQNEVNTVLSNYFPNSPFFQMTNVAGLGGTNVTFALSNDLAGAFSVEYTTNLLDWLFLGPAIPRYEFTDTNAPAIPQRYYRLRWP